MGGSTKRGVAEWLLACCGVWLVGLGLYFVFLRPALLPEDIRFFGIQPGILQTTVPRLAEWLGLVFTVMGGFMAGAGVLVAYFALTLMPQRPPGAMPVLVLTGVMTVGLMSAINLKLQSDFRWLLLAPPLVWAAAVVTYIRRD
jgi:hypothetical protein